MYNTSSSFSKELGSDNWVKEIKKLLEDEKAGETPVCIHKVRKAVKDTKPEAYSPHYISLGPYHFDRGELFQMLFYKLLALKNSHVIGFQNKQQPLEIFCQTVETLKNQHIARIRASYDRHLAKGETPLAWIMFLDSIFLLEFLLEFTHEKRSCLSKMRRTCHLVDRTESAYHSILQDIMMFENQIPIFVLDHILQSCCIANDYQPNLLGCMLLNTCKMLSPLKYDESKLKTPNITEYAHLLELLYYLIVPQPNNHYNSQDLDEDDTTQPLQSKTQYAEQKHPRNCVPYNIILSFIVGHFEPLKLLLKVCGDVPCEKKLNDVENNIIGGGSSSTNKKEAPEVEEIQIPTVSSLVNVGINICCTNDGSITSIRFDRNTQILHLPRIKIDANTEVVIRNLVAYEAEVVSGPLVLARYTELMNGIIDTAEDVELLRRRKILVSYLKNDEDVAEIWNGMSRSIRLSHFHPLDEVIKEVNVVYESKIKVKFLRYTKKCTVNSWRIFMLFLAMVLMVLMAIQSFCDVYNCPSAIATVAAPPD